MGAVPQLRFASPAAAPTEAELRMIAAEMTGSGGDGVKRVTEPGFLCVKTP